MKSTTAEESLLLSIDAAEWTRWHNDKETVRNRHGIVHPCNATFRYRMLLYTELNPGMPPVRIFEAVSEAGHTSLCMVNKILRKSRFPLRLP